MPAVVANSNFLCRHLLWYCIDMDMDMDMYGMKFKWNELISLFVAELLCWLTSAEDLLHI